MAARQLQITAHSKGIPEQCCLLPLAGGQTLASGSADRTIKVWHLATGELLSNFTGHTKPVWSVAFSTDKQTLASGSGDRNIKLWLVSRQNSKLKLKHLNTLPEREGTQGGSRRSNMAKY